MSEAAAAGLIGPNAITRVAQVLPVWRGTAFTEALFEGAGLQRYWRQPPEQMVPEADVRSLHRALRQALPAGEAAAVSRGAGRATADYLLTHRIPHPVQRLLRVLPASLAARVLVAAITRHAWTFAGSGRFQATPPRRGQPWLLQIQGNPLCLGLQADIPACDYYAATFERLFQVLVQRNAQVEELACEACGAPACVFALRW